MRLEPAIPVANRDEMTEEEWLSLRRKGIGGSDVAGVLRLSKWKTPSSVWFEKVEGGAEEMSIAAEVGTNLEPYLRSKVVPWFAENEGAEVTFYQHGWMLRHPTIPYLVANPDDVISHPERGNCVIEYKTTSEWRREEWGEEELPDAYYAQVQHYMEVMDCDHSYVFALIGNRSIEVRYVPRNQDFIDRMVAECVAFWENYVLTKEPPAPVGEDIDTEILKLIYEAEEAEKVVDLSHMQAEYDRYKALNEAYKDAEKGLKELKQHFMAAMGDAEVAMVGEHKITWKTVEKKGYEVKPSKSRQLRVW